MKKDRGTRKQCTVHRDETEKREKSWKKWEKEKKRRTGTDGEAEAV